MKKIVLTYGVISGLVMSALLVATIPFMRQSGHGAVGMVVGYTIMLASLLLVYFGVRTYREQHGGGCITFGRAFSVGLLIALICCVFYVLTWEIIFYGFMPDFMDQYGAAMIKQAEASGVTGAALQAKIATVHQQVAMYKKPFWNCVMTFMEPLPVALVMALVSAALLRKKKPVDSAGFVVEA
jgi:hypothetical protein